MCWCIKKKKEEYETVKRREKKEERRKREKGFTSLHLRSVVLYPSFIRSNPMRRIDEVTKNKAKKSN